VAVPRRNTQHQTNLKDSSFNPKAQRCNSSILSSSRYLLFLRWCGLPRGRPSLYLQSRNHTAVGYCVEHYAELIVGNGDLSTYIVCLLLSDHRIHVSYHLLSFHVDIELSRTCGVKIDLSKHEGYCVVTIYQRNVVAERPTRPVIWYKYLELLHRINGFLSCQGCTTCPLEMWCHLNSYILFHQH
jgi:hypothetical protein